MKNKIEKIKNFKYINYIIITVIGLLICIPLIWLQIRPTHDGWLHLIRLIGLDKSIGESNFPFLVAPYLCRNFGYSINLFYGPLVIYIPYLLGLVSGTFANGLKIFAGLTILLSGYFMYNMMYEITERKGISLLSAIIYMILPYRLENIYTRFAIGEFTAFTFIPLVFQGIYNLLNKDGKKHYYIAIGAIGLILSHTISTVYIAMFCVLYLIFNWKKTFKKNVIIKCIINVLIILLISAFFLIPMLEHKLSAQYSIFTPTVMKTYGSYTQKNTIELWQLLKDKGEENGVSFIVGVPVIFTFFVGILVYRNLNKKEKDIYNTFLIFTLISLFMCTNFCPWYYLPGIFNVIQYPWRMLGFALCFATPICGINLYYLFSGIKKEKIRIGAYVLSIIVILVFTAQLLNRYKEPDKTIDSQYEQKLKKDLAISHFALNRDYLPYKAILLQNTYLKEREDRVYVLSGNGTIENETKQALDMSFEIFSMQKNTELELPYFFYLGFDVELQTEDEIIKLETIESKNGFLSIIIPKDIEQGKITLTYNGTFIEKTSYVISIISFTGFILYIVYEKIRNKETTERNVVQNEN